MTWIIQLALFINAVFICFDKWKVWRFLDVYERRRHSWMPDWCEFCVVFWTGLIYSILHYKCMNVDSWFFVFHFIKGMCVAALFTVFRAIILRR